jgi:hypothetical protein
MLNLVCAYIDNHITKQAVIKVLDQ